MRRFFNDLSITRYKLLASGTLTALERKAMFELLAKERADLRDHWNARLQGVHVAAEKGCLIQFALNRP